MGVNIGNKTLKDAYIGDKPIKQIYLGDKLLWQRLPYDAEIEYLESSGTQFINIPNVIPTNYDKVSGQLFGNSGTGNFILGNDI